jgi:hypothetical protein
MPRRSCCCTASRSTGGSGARSSRRSPSATAWSRPTSAALAGRTRRPTVHPGRGSRRRARAARHAWASAGRARRPRLQCGRRVPALLRPPGRCRGLLCLGPHPNSRFKPQMRIPQLWFQPFVATPGLGPWALRTDRLARHLLAESTTTPDSITDEDLAVFTGRLHAQGHPEAGSALYRNLILPEMGRFLASASYRRGGSPSRPSRSWAALMPASGRACSMSLRRPGGRPRRPHHRRRGTFPRR